MHCKIEFDILIAEYLKNIIHMETRFQTNSFIPKTSLDNVVAENGQIQRSKTSGSTTGSLVTLLCFFLFVCSLVSAGVVFFLGKLANTTKVQAQKDLAEYQKRNTTETIQKHKIVSINHCKY